MALRTAPELDQLFASFPSPQVSTFSTPCSGASGGSGTVSRPTRARGPAALHGLVREDGEGGRGTHQEAAYQTLRWHPPENRRRLGEPFTSTKPASIFISSPTSCYTRPKSFELGFHGNSLNRFLRLMHLVPLSGISWFELSHLSDLCLAASP